jgi:predicted nucleic acid-binding protein
MARVYLDACCLNRPFDDQRQPRIRLESEAVVFILARIQAGNDVWISSEVLDYELDQTPDLERRQRVQALTVDAGVRVELDNKVVERTQQITLYGFSTLDAAHIACAEAAQAEVFLTTDDKLLRRAQHNASRLYVDVTNPMVWLSEVGKNERV